LAQLSGTGKKSSDIKHPFHRETIIPVTSIALIAGSKGRTMMFATILLANIAMQHDHRRGILPLPPMRGRA
jgi:hypothetical protein